MNKILIIGLLIIGVLLSGCTQESDSAPQPAAPVQAAGEETVTVEHTKFTPASLTIKKGTTVTWKNLNSMIHPVASDGMFDSGNLGLNQDYSHTFNDVGTFSVTNTAHGVTMTVVVTE